MVRTDYNEHGGRLGNVKIKSIELRWVGADKGGFVPSFPATAPALAHLARLGCIEVRKKGLRISPEFEMLKRCRRQKCIGPVSADNIELTLQSRELGPPTCLGNRKIRLPLPPL